MHPLAQRRRQAKFVPSLQSHSVLLIVVPRLENIATNLETSRRVSYEDVLNVQVYVNIYLSRLVGESQLAAIILITSQPLGHCKLVYVMLFFSPCQYLSPHPTRLLTDVDTQIQTLGKKFVVYEVLFSTGGEHWVQEGWD